MGKYRTELKWSAIFFFTTILWLIIEKMMGWHDEKITEHATYSIIYDGLFILIFVLAFWNRRRQSGFKGFSWRNGVAYGMVITCIITVLSPLVQTIMHKFISPDFFQNVIEIAVNHNLMTLAEARNKFNLGNYILENLIGTFALGTLCSLVLAFLFKK